MPKLPGTIGKYKILDRLGRGGMSILYKAEHPSLGTPVVLKKLTLKGDSAHRERFRREATLMMKLRHDNVVGVYDHFKEGAGHFLVMEFVDGRPLSELLAREGALPPEEAAWLAGRIAVALAHIHSRGVVHRDLKPSNVLLGRDGTVKLGDFGIAFSPGGDEDITSEGTALGTPSFMAPEQLEDARKADERSDMWSFGVCLFELLTGRKFVTGPSPAAIREALPSAVAEMSRRLPQGLPANLKKILRRCLRMKHDFRLKDGQAAVRLLKAARDSKEPPAGLNVRLGNLIAVMEGRAEPTPEAVPKTDKGDPAGLRSAFRPPGAERSAIRRFLDNLQGSGSIPKTEVPGNDPRRRHRLAQAFKSRPLILTLLSILLASLLVLLLIPGAWDLLFRSGSHGLLSLKLVYPESAPESWLIGAEVNIYRESSDTLQMVASPGLRKSGDERSLVSRRLSLPSGAYRLSWSLGEKITWQSFRLPTIRENREKGRGPLLLEETLGAPPSFPMSLDWTAHDALDGEDISSRVNLEWERVDEPGGPMMSGGRYRFRFISGGYQSASFAVAASPWRRNLVIDVALWPVPGKLTVRNGTAGTVVPKLNGSGAYLELSGIPEVRRIGRLKPGEETTLVLPPGDYGLTAGWWRHPPLRIRLSSGGSVVAVMESGNGGAPEMRIPDLQR